MHFPKTVIFVSAIAFVIAILFTCNRCNPTPIQEGSEQVDTLKWINGAGDIVASLKADPSYFNKVRQEIIDSLAMTNKTKVKYIIEYVIAKTQGESEIKPDGPTAAEYFPVNSTKDCPPIKSLSKRFSNPYYIIDAKISAPGVEDSSFIHLLAYDTATAIWKWVKEGNIFNLKKSLQIDVSLANPDIRVYGIEAYRAPELTHEFSINAEANTNWFTGLNAELNNAKTVVGVKYGKQWFGDRQGSYGELYLKYKIIKIKF